MRLRKVANANEFLQENQDYVILDPYVYKGQWHEYFKNQNPIHIEVGTGKGKFIHELAKANPCINYIGIEVVSSVLIRAVKKSQIEKLDNLILVYADASNLHNIFAEKEIERIYLNFSDPWPKNRHEKRRLTYKKFLSIYKMILVDKGDIHLKTDNQSFFEYSLVSMSQFGMIINYVSLDLHKSDFVGNIMTEYEERFVSLGQKIYRLEAMFR
ncbi:MAG TPA: tRNA (guanosine(46)-N7)-methyltransferase TrmB [Haloplasmataceae bacterium]